MRRTQRDVHALFEAYCQAWQHPSYNRMKRLEAHGWVDGVWLRDYDGVARMAPTERGSSIVQTYWRVLCNGNEPFEEYQGVPQFVEAAVLSDEK